MPAWPFEVFLLGSVGCARIPILARSINAPHQRPDTVSQLSRRASVLPLPRGGRQFILAQVHGVLLMLRAVLVLLIALLPSYAGAEPRIALVIGNSAYQHTRKLANPRNDAADMAA